MPLPNRPSLPSKNEVVAQAVENLYYAPDDGDTRYTSDPTAALTTALNLRGDSTILFRQRLTSDDVKVIVDSVLDIGDDPDNNLDADSLAIAASKPRIFLTDIDLSRNAIDDAGATALADLFRLSTADHEHPLRTLRVDHLSRLNLAFNRIGSDGAQDLAEILCDYLDESNGSMAASGQTMLSCSLTALDLSGNPLGDTGVDWLSRAVERNSRLSALVLGHLDLEHYQVLVNLCLAVERHPTLEYLDLENPKITTLHRHTNEAGVANDLLPRTFGRMVQRKRGQPIRRLNLSKNTLTDSGFSLFLDTLMESMMRTAPTVDRSAVVAARDKATNHHQHQSASEHADPFEDAALYVVNPVEAEDYERAQLEVRFRACHEGFIAAWKQRELQARAIRSRRAQHRSDRGPNRGGGDDGEDDDSKYGYGDEHGLDEPEAQDPFTVEIQLERLDLRCNRIALGRHGSGPRLCRFLQLNTQTRLRALNLQANMIGDDGAQILAYALCVNQSLEAIDVRSNGIGYLGITALSLALQNENRTLKSLRLWGNKFDSRSAKLLQTSLKIAGSTCAVDLRFYVVDQQTLVAEDSLPATLLD